MEAVKNSDFIDWSEAKEAEIMLIIEQIAKDLAEGQILTKICKQENYPPYSIVCKWRRKYPEINSILDEAYQDRAEYFHDLAVTTAKNSDDGSWAPSAFQARVYQWAAGVGNPERYSDKAKIHSVGKQNITCIVHTGIIRTPFAEATAQGSRSQLNLNDSSSAGPIPSTDEYLNKTET